MLGRRALTHWPQAIVEEVGILVAHWKTANSLTERARRAVQWASSPPPMPSYLDELLSAHPLSAGKR